MLKTSVGYDVAIADTRGSVKQIEQYLLHELESRKNKSMSISSLASKVHEKFPHFNVKDTGYSQFYKFVDSISGVRVIGGMRKQAKLE